MPKFSVRIKGGNLEVEVEERKWVFWRNNYTKKVGFLTTRFIETESANEAIEQVFDIVNIELRNDGRFTEQSTIELEEIQEDEKAFDLYAPGGGFTFFEMNNQ